VDKKMLGRILYIVGFDNGPHNFLYQELGTWVCILPLLSHFWLSR
jgi:hypothetical protein